MKSTTANQILHTATSLFATAGFDKVTIKQLVQAVNVNSAAISYHFGGKENLYQAVLTKQFSPVLQALRERDIGSGSATERLLDYAAMMAAFKRRQPYLTSLWQYEMNRYEVGQSSSAAKEYTTEFYLTLLAALSHGLAQREFHSDLEPYPTAAVLLEMLHAPYVPVSLLPPSASNTCKDYAVQAIDLFLRGIRYFPS